MRHIYLYKIGMMGEFFWNSAIPFQPFVIKTDKSLRHLLSAAGITYKQILTSTSYKEQH